LQFGTSCGCIVLPAHCPPSCAATGAGQPKSWGRSWRWCTGCVCQEGPDGGAAPGQTCTIPPPCPACCGERGPDQRGPPRSPGRPIRHRRRPGYLQDYVLSDGVAGTTNPSRGGYVAARGGAGSPHGRADDVGGLRDYGECYVCHEGIKGGDARRAGVHVGKNNKTLTLGSCGVWGTEQQ